MQQDGAGFPVSAWRGALRVHVGHQQPGSSLGASISRW